MRSSSMRSENSAPAASAPPPNSAKDMSSGQSNVFKLLARRELSPQTKKTPKRFWVKVTGDQVDSCCLKSEIAKDARQELRSWAEAESLLHLSAKYCPLQPPPRSTIAAAFSPDGKTLASTHGDHTVKIIDCQTGTCLKVLTDRPIASIAFHAQGEFLAVASGHKLYIWYYSRRGEASSPMIILRTRRSLRAVHFHPHGAPLLLTAEVNDLNSSDPTMTIATCAGYSRYPPPTIYVADPNPPYHSNSGNESPFVSMPFLIFPSLGRGESGPTSQQQDVIQPQRADSSTSVRLLTYSTPSGQYELVLSPIQSPAREEPQDNINNDDSNNNNNTNNSSLHRETDNTSTYQPSTNVVDGQAEEAANQFFPFGDPTHWELPFLQGWLIGQSQVG
ncbi:transducin family protein / WD-40 repeat family protein, partial [Striga asiatica]